MLLVDAYNVLHTTGVLPPHLAGLDVPGLIRLIGLSRYARRPITLVCDGAASRRSGVSIGSARVLFSGIEAEADDVIERLIVRYAGGGTLAVVSSDRRLRRAARVRHADSISSDEFLAHLAADEAVPPPPSGMPRFVTEIPLDRYSVDLWLEEFGFGDRAARETHPAESPADAGVQPPRPQRHTITPRSKPPVSRPSLGERLAVPPLPAPPERSPTDARAPTPAPPPAPAEPAETASREPDPPDRRDSAQPGCAPDDLDPVLRRALEEWRDRLTLDDLDMQRWVDDVTPIKRKEDRG